MAAKGGVFILSGAGYNILNMSDINLLKSAVFGRQNVLAKIYAQQGSVSLFDYVTGWQTGSGSVNESTASIIRDLAGKYLTHNEAQELFLQIQSHPLVSTVDHHGIFGHPFFLNANLLFSLRKELKYLPVFSTNGVSLNNSSWPGCLVLTNPKTGVLERLSFFHDGHKTKTVFGADKISPVETARVLEQIKNLSFLSFRQKEKLTRLVERVFLSPHVLEQNNFSDQTCVISHMLWQEIFPSAPKLVYLPLEDITAQILIKDIAANPSHILHKLFFTPAGWQLTEKYFTGLRGAFSETRGSFLFWGVDEEDKRMALHREGLKIKDLGLKVEHQLTSEVISSSLGKRTIYPTSLVCFLVMLTYNFNCLGGFNQTSWLTEIKEKFIALLMEMGENGLSEQVNKVVTDNFAETPLAFSYTNGLLTKPSLLDLYLNSVDYESLEQRAKKITLAQSLETELPEIYKIAVPQADRLVSLSAINPTQIAENNGLTKILSLL